MIRAPRLQRFQSPTSIIDARSKSLPTDLWAYKLAGPGGNQYGLDTIFADDTPPPDEANMALWIPVADGQRRDGVGDLLEVGGIDVERHRKNPLCLFDHGKKVDLPIGLFETRDNHRYTFEIDPVTKSAGGWAYFYQGKDLMGVTQGKAYEHALFCEQTFDMACKRLIRGGSIGYQVKAARELQPDYERGTPKGLHLLKILMLEGSLVVLPANMDTVGKLLSDGVCCGKSLSPLLVKSLSAYAPERKAMVAVPLAGLPKTKIPPAEWRPGLGAVKSNRLPSNDPKEVVLPPGSTLEGASEVTASRLHGHNPAERREYIDKGRHVTVSAIKPSRNSLPASAQQAKSVEGEEEKGYHEDQARREQKPSFHENAQRAFGVGGHSTAASHTIKHPMPQRPTGIGGSSAPTMGGGFTRKELRQKYRTKGHGSARTSNVISQNDPKTGAYRLITHGVPAEHQVGATAKPQSARRSAKIGKNPAATTARVHATIHRDDVAASNAPVVGEPVGTHGPVAIYGDAIKPAAAPAQTSTPAAHIKVPSQQYQQMAAAAPVARGVGAPTKPFRRIKELRAKYSKSVVPRDEARRLILAGRHAGHQQNRAGSENAIPERDTNLRRSDEIGAGRANIPGKRRPPAPNPTGPTGGREVRVPESKINTKIDPPTVNVRKPQHKDQPSSHIDPAKARQILKDGTVNGKPLTPSQRRMFGAAAGRGEKILFVHPGAKKPKEHVSAGNLGVGARLSQREIRGPVQNETVDPEKAELMAATQKPGKTERVYTRDGRHFRVSGIISSTPNVQSRARQARKVKSLRAKYKSGKRELTHSGATEKIGHSEGVHEHVSYGGRPQTPKRKPSGSESIRVPGPEPSKGRVLPIADVKKKPTSKIPEPKAKKPKVSAAKPVAASQPAKPAKKPYVPDSAAVRQREAVIRHEQSRNYPKNQHIQRAIQEADRAVGPKVQRQEEHRSTRRIGAAHRLTPLPESSRGMMRKSLLDETDEQRAVILELNQKVVALARQLA